MKKRTSGPSGPSTPRGERTRRPLEITLSDEAREILDGLAKRCGTSRSAVVEALVLGAVGDDATPNEG